MQISPQNFSFLTELTAHNYREWFAEHKPEYESAHQNIIVFTEALFDLLSEEDQLVPMTGKQALFRIYRDVRFSKDKSPYKTRWSGRFKRDTPWLRGGYYFQVGPAGQTMVAGGFFNPNKEDLARIRMRISEDPSKLRRVIHSQTYIKHFGQLTGDQVKTSPKGYSKDHPAIDLLRYKQFIVQRTFSDQEALEADLVAEMVSSFTAMRPFFDYMSEILTYDVNGVPLVEEDS